MRIALLCLSVTNWFLRLGGFGFILLGLADNSVVPLPGSMDLLTIVLASSKREWWWYYAFMATLGSVIGGAVTYRLAREGGKEFLEKKIGARKAQKVYQHFERWGFWAVAVPAVLPPPVPIVPFLASAGALQYERTKFYGALTLGRAVRFTIVAYLASLYGHSIYGWMTRYYKPILWTLLGLLAVGIVVALVFYRKYKKSKEAGKRTRPRKKVA